tara:strand:- start:128 stop:358 length:231 start_codon:yes stop_codon:yes gene_type:complete
MKKVNNYIVYIGLGLLALGIFIAFVMGRAKNDKTVTDSLAKARKVKEQKRQERIKKQEEEEINKEAQEIINTLTKN